VWISFLIGKRMYRLSQYILNERIVIISCNAQIRELLRVVEKPSIKKLVLPYQIDAFFKFLGKHAVIIPVTTNVKLCRDPKDDYLLSLAIDAKAHYLITGDNDLLVLQHVNSTSIFNFIDFEKIMNTKQDKKIVVSL
jgi:putative PIN family toxin of toxin-antitoxin system